MLDFFQVAGQCPNVKMLSATWRALTATTLVMLVNRANIGVLVLLSVDLLIFRSMLSVIDWRIDLIDIRNLPHCNNPVFQFIRCHDFVFPALCLSVPPHATDPRMVISRVCSHQANRHGHVLCCLFLRLVGERRRSVRERQHDRTGGRNTKK